MGKKKIFGYELESFEDLLFTRMSDYPSQFNKEDLKTEAEKVHLELGGKPEDNITVCIDSFLKGLIKEDFATCAGNIYIWNE